VCSKSAQVEAVTDLSGSHRREENRSLREAA
jgi:hypothetical protein